MHLSKGLRQCLNLNSSDWNKSFQVCYIPCDSAGEESACGAGDLGSIPGLGRSPGEGNGYPLQYSDLENSRGYTVHGVAKSWTRLSNFHFHFKGNNVCFLMYCFLDTFHLGLLEPFIYLLPTWPLSHYDILIKVMLQIIKITVTAALKFLSDIS